MDVRRTGPLFFVIITTFVLAACAPPAVPPTPTATWTQTPTLAPTSTSTPTPVPTATGTSTPTATTTPRPTWTSTALPTVTQTPTPQPEIELPIGLLAFISPEQQLLVREPAGAIRATTEEGIARSPAWSPDGTRLAFSYQADDRSPAEVRIYDPEEGTQVTVWTDPGELAPLVLPFRKIAWSPSGRYLFLSQGCCFVGALYVVDIESGTLVGRYASGTELWSPETDLLALSVRQPVEHLIPIESGDSYSIALVRPGQITPTVVLTGTEERLYLAKAWLGEDELLYEQLDLYEGGERTERSWGVAEIDGGLGGQPSVIAARSLDALPVKYDDEAFAERLSPWLPGVTFAEQVWSADGAWVVFRAYGDEEAPDVNRIYAFQWEEGLLVGPLAEGTDLALAPIVPPAPPADAADEPAEEEKVLSLHTVPHPPPPEQPDAVESVELEPLAVGAIVGPSTFGFRPPFIAGRTVEVQQTAEAGGVAITLEKVVVTPSETQATLCFVSRDRSKEWLLVAGDGQYLSDGNTSQRLAASGEECHRLVYSGALTGRFGRGMLKVTELVGFDPTGQGEQTRLAGPWVFRFRLP
jgi:dipeptidyl aminopeptidase/acylaminoacyl peptidase